MDGVQYSWSQFSQKLDVEEKNAQEIRIKIATAMSQQRQNEDIHTISIYIKLCTLQHGYTFNYYTYTYTCMAININIYMRTRYLLESNIAFYCKRDSLNTHTGSWHI